MKIKLLIILFIQITFANLQAQIGVDTTLKTPYELVTEYLVSGCIKVMNVNYTGSAAALGGFGSASGAFIFEQGLILATGKATNAIGPDDDIGTINGVDFGLPGDANLDNVSASNQTYDACVLEFDFVPNVDTIRFNYIFASEEYPEKVCSDTNDVIGIFLSGPGVALTNLAVIPGTTIPVNANSVNSGTSGSCATCNYCLSLAYDGLYAGGNTAWMQYDGFTEILEAKSWVSPCQTYHMKICIADGGDGLYDSGLFIEAGSFGEPTTPTGQNYSSVGADNDIYEGCENYYIFNRPETSGLGTAYTFDILITGNAINGIDYSTFPTTITIPIGELTDTIFYSAFIDNNNENTEYFIISLLGECTPCTFSPTNDTIFIRDNYTLNAGIVENDTTICTIIPVGYTLNAFIPSGMDQSIVSYQWSNNSTNASISVIPALGAATTYCLTITDACGQIAVDCITFTISDLAGLNVVAEDLSCFEICEGTVTGTPVNGFAPYTYLVDTITSTSNVITGLCADNYKLYVIDSMDCIDSAVFVITQPTLVVPEYSSIPASCAGLDDGKAIVTIVGGVPPYEFLWSTGYVFNGIVSDTLNSIGAGVYSITITDNNGCTQFINGTVEEPEPYSLISSSSTYICLGQTTTMTIEGMGGTTPYFYEWESGFTGGAYSVTPLETTTYWITGHDLNDCKADTSFITIFIYPDINATLAADKDSICKGDEVTIFIDSIWGGTNGPYTVKFSDEVHTDILAPPYILYPEQTTTYSITVDDWCGSNQGHASITIAVFNEPEIEIFADVTEGCIPLEVNFSELLYEEGREYIWDFGDGYADIGADLSNPKHTFLNEGTFDISVDVTSPMGCKNSREAQNLITVFQKPEARFIAHPQIVSIIKPIVYFEDESDVSQGYLNYYWDFDGLNDTLINTQSPEFVFNEIGTYSIKLLVESNKGCLDSVFQEIVVKDEYTFYAPNAFSPNSNIFDNQTFMPRIIGVDPDNFHMIIYDRWGQKIFETFDIYHPWDGKSYGQDVEKASTYPWVVIYKDLHGGDHRKSGTVTVIF